MLSVEKTQLQRLREDDIESLMHAHWRECSIDQEEVPLDPDWEMAATMERCGILHCFGLYEDRDLIGYAVFEVSRHLFHKSTKYAWNQAIFVQPESRRGNAAIKLFVESENFLVRLGVKKITYLSPHRSNLNRLLESAHYRPSETYFTKLVN